MPIYYANQGVLLEHIYTYRIRFLESLVVTDIEEMLFGSSVLSVFTNENSGIIDDTVICKHTDHLYVMSNVACADKDLAHVRTKMEEFQKK
ncbi:hypothetical protein C2G38_2121283, partial [Gigaspora rosea]